MGVRYTVWVRTIWLLIGQDEEKGQTDTSSEQVISIFHFYTPVLFCFILKTQRTTIDPNVAQFPFLV